MARMDDMERMDGMDAMDTDPTIAICLNCTAADCRGSCYRINRILAGHPDPGPGTETNSRVYYGQRFDNVKAVAEKWGKSVSTIYDMSRKRHMSLDDIDQYYADRAEKAAFLDEMRPYTGDSSNVYRLLREGKTYDEIRAIYRNRPQNVA